MKQAPDLYVITQSTDPDSSAVPNAFTKPELIVWRIEHRHKSDPRNLEHAQYIAEEDAHAVIDAIWDDELGLVQSMTYYMDHQIDDAAPESERRPLTPLTREAVCATYGIQNIIADPSLKKPTTEELLNLAKAHNCVRVLDRATFYQASVYDGNQANLAVATYVLVSPDDIVTGDQSSEDIPTARKLVKDEILPKILLAAHATGNANVYELYRDGMMGFTLAAQEVTAPHPTSGWPCTITALTFAHRPTPQEVADAYKRHILMRALPATGLQ